MTKFEEEFDEKIMPHKDNLDLMKVRKHFKDWHSDEQFQKLLEQNADWSQECKNINQINSQLTKENEDLKSQLQQQALPVVPECVGKELYNIDFNYWIENKMTLACFTARTLNWLEQHRGDWNIEYYICKLRFGGFTVEKTQLFYLKHIDMSKADKECDWYLITDCVKLCHEWVGKNLKPKDDDFKFTQAEIDSMQTGSYEQIEVAE